MRCLDLFSGVLLLLVVPAGCSGLGIEADSTQSDGSTVTPVTVPTDRYCLVRRSSPPRLVCGCRALDSAADSCSRRRTGESTRSAGSVAHPRVVEAFDTHFQCLEPLFYQISRDVVEVTAQIGLREGGQVAHAVDQKFRLGEVVALFQLGKERAGGARGPPARDAHAKQKLRIHVERSVQPEPFATELDRGLVDRDPRRCSPRRVGGFLANTMSPLKDRLM